jgi:peptidyl-prolyl cis-trans isomerase C
MSPTRRLWIVPCFFFATAAVAWSQPVAEPVLKPPAPAKVAALVNGKPILESALDQAMKGVPDDKKKEARAEILNILIDNSLLDQYLIGQGVRVEPKEVDARLTEIKKQMAAQQQVFAKVLQDMNLTEEEFRGQLVSGIRWQKLVDSQASEKSLRELFDKNPEMFDGTMVHARHILLAPGPDAAAQQKAVADLRALRKQIEDAAARGVAKLPPTADAVAKEKERIRITEETFAALAKEKSACPSKERGGDVGTFPRLGAMVEPFAKAAFALKPYEMSDVVATPFGYHLILVVERLKRQEPRNTFMPPAAIQYEDVKDDVREVFGGRMRDELLGRLRQTAKVEIVK